MHQRYYVRGFEVCAAVSYLTLWGSGGPILYDRNKFLAIGRFEELFAPFGWEDVEICVRARKQGFVGGRRPEVRAYGEDVALLRACPYSPQAGLIVPMAD